MVTMTTLAGLFHSTMVTSLAVTIPDAGLHQAVRAITTVHVMVMFFILAVVEGTIMEVEVVAAPLAGDTGMLLTGP